jgi:hypothetical protein
VRARVQTLATAPLEGVPLKPSNKGCVERTVRWRRSLFWTWIVLSVLWCIFVSLVLYGVIPRKGATDADHQTRGDKTRNDFSRHAFLSHVSMIVS